MVKPKVANLREEWVICNGSPIHYWKSTASEYANSETLIHLHGFGISGTYLLPTADLLADRFRSFVPDLPGYGRSVHPEHVLSIPELADVVIRFMDVQGVERATLVGNSMGCIVAVEAARSAPDRIERMVLVSPAGGRNNRPVFKGVGQLALDGVREPPRMFFIAVPDYLRFGFINAGRLFWEMIHYPTVDRFRDASIETLVVLGARDPLVNATRITEGTASNDRIQVVRVNGAAHAINYSHPETLAYLVQRFIEGKPFAEDDSVTVKSDEAKLLADER